MAIKLREGIDGHENKEERKREYVLRESGFSLAQDEFEKTGFIAFQKGN